MLYNTPLIFIENTDSTDKAKVRFHVPGENSVLYLADDAIYPGLTSRTTMYKRPLQLTIALTTPLLLLGLMLTLGNAQSSGAAYLVKDINPGLDQSSPGWWTNLNGTFFFFADDGVQGNELWKSDGTAVEYIAGNVENAELQASFLPYPARQQYLSDLKRMTT